MSSVVAEGPVVAALEEPGCPKHMAYGPCGGVRAEGSCEVDARPCPFVARELVSWVGGPPGVPAPQHASAHELGKLASRRPIVIGDMPACSLDLDLHRRAAAVLAQGCDAGMSGDTPWARVQLPPTLRAELLADEGLRAWVVLTCRDANRVALEGELAGLVAVGAAGVHCVTGDHTSGGDRPDARGVFDLDSTRLTALARGSGLLVSVAESPATPPVALRVGRLVSKARAGAGWCMINVVEDHHLLADFVAQARALAPSVRFVVSVPVGSVPVGSGGVGLGGVGSGGVGSGGVGSDGVGSGGLGCPVGSWRPAGRLDGLDGNGYRRGGAGPVGAAVRLAERALGIDGVSGINLSAPAGGAPGAVARDLAAVGRALGGGR